MIVDEVLASCYATVDHDEAHIMMTPIRWFPQTMDWISGEENELKALVPIAEKFAKWMLPDKQFSNM